MKRYEADDEASIRAVLDHLNSCHDGSLRRICFIKEREWTDEGNLVYPCSDPKGFAECDVEIELLLNSYVGAVPTQVVMLYFKEVRTLQFSQEDGVDYSDIHELIFCSLKDEMFQFSFHATPRKVKVLTLACRKLVCQEE